MGSVGPAASARSRTARSSRTAKKSSAPECLMDPWILPPSVETFASWTDGLLLGSLTLCVEDSPVRTSQPQDSRPGSTEGEAASGSTWDGSFARFDLGSCSWKTSQLSLLGGWSEFSETWPQSGTTLNGSAFQLQPLAPTTSETECGSWPTPKASAANYGRPRRDERGDLQAAVMRWPTPNASDARKWNAYNAEERREKGNQVRLGNAVSSAEGCRVAGNLNPMWVEWLMGFPIGWSALAPLATPSSPRLSSGSGEGS